MSNRLVDLDLPILGSGRWRTTYRLNDREVLKVPHKKVMDSYLKGVSKTYQGCDGELENVREIETYQTGTYEHHTYGTGSNWLLFKKWFELAGEPLPLNKAEAEQINGFVCLRAPRLEEKRAWASPNCFVRAMKAREFGESYWVALVDSTQASIDPVSGKLVCFDYNFWDDWPTWPSTTFEELMAL